MLTLAGMLKQIAAGPRQKQSRAIIADIQTTTNTKLVLGAMVLRNQAVRIVPDPTRSFLKKQDLAGIGRRHGPVITVEPPTSHRPLRKLVIGMTGR